MDIFNQYKSLLGVEVLRSLRDIFDENKEEREVIYLSTIIKDLDYLEQAINKVQYPHPRYYLDYANLLIEEIKSDKAIEVLKSIDPKLIKHLSDFIKWKKLLIQALTEEGRKKEAIHECIESFKFSPNAHFYRAYIEIEGESTGDVNLFVEIAQKRGVEYYISFLSEISRFDLIENYIVNASSDALAHLVEIFRGPTIRSLSSELYKQGYALPAVLLRRCLIENSINLSQSKYYSYAVSDLKKSIDYSIDVKNNTILSDTQTYLSFLYEKHKRKTALWPLMIEKIKGISIGPEGICYERG
ncbi:hypothetical protein B7R74_08280 [Yersinia pseudotuberculosis]|uniref:SpnT protein n=1 Tax=Yersinia pseudotuberculosis TaxID=633 RepID=A0A380Q569_YERPU|nr:DUF6880 family protein [Yersinia pseudotuberculosis]PSH22055.1 hypothetical protein B7R74_08280 [Yersinia pseudotuberculosis]SUP80709.1 Uncharacterised protein [Yersinia pseudotuberculosis]